jgi:hypothetical protein
MTDWMGMGLIAFGLGLIGHGIMKRQARLRSPLPAGSIRPEYAAMGEIVRPMILFFVGLFAFKMSLFYFLLNGQRFLTPLEFGGVLFVLAAYSGWLILAMKRPVIAPARNEAIPSGERSVV